MNLISRASLFLVGELKNHNGEIGGDDDCIVV